MLKQKIECMNPFEESNLAGIFLLDLHEALNGSVDEYNALANEAGDGDSDCDSEEDFSDEWLDLFDADDYPKEAFAVYDTLVAYDKAVNTNASTSTINEALEAIKKANKDWLLLSMS